jgi:hypothetical protein
MAKEIWIVRYGFESLVGRDQYDWRDNWSRQKYNWWGFYALLKHKGFGNSSCELHHTSAK